MSLLLAETRIQALSLVAEGCDLLDQTQLPEREVKIRITTPQEMIAAIQALVVRGAPAIGVAGGFGAVLSARLHQHQSLPVAYRAIQEDLHSLYHARPTAVNLMWAVKRFQLLLDEASWSTTMDIVTAFETLARTIEHDDIKMCQQMGHHGASLIPTGAGILTHCNTGALATAGIGTALGVVRTAFINDKTLRVFADETRPRLQGAKLTVWECLKDDIPVTLLSDNMSAWLMKQGQVDVVMVGADRIAKNGDTANKIGTYLLALAAKAHDIPFYVVAPSSTLDITLANGEAIPIEERSAREVTHFEETALSVDDSRLQVFNPAFDVTPGSLITAIITEQGIHRAPYCF
jgi:methylthioribose-1-phosphate isomerase